MIMEVLEKFQAFIWGPPTLLLLLGTGIYFTVTLKGIQLFRFPKALKAIFEKEEGAGDVSAFATLCTTLAADIGTGSIVGVATALRIGGPGAMFWMWVSAFFGMTTKYAESVLAVKYRTKDENGQMAGGPMYYIQNGMGKEIYLVSEVIRDIWCFYSAFRMWDFSAGQCNYGISKSGISHSNRTGGSYRYCVDCHRYFRRYPVNIKK